MIAAWALALAAQAAAPEPAPAPAPVPVAEAIAYFRFACVGTMPDPHAFAVLIDDVSRDPQSIAWVPFEKNDRGARVAGHYWRSRLGELAYLYLPGLRGLAPSPACHYSFRTEAGFSQDAAAAALTRALDLPPGRATGTRAAPQTRWESRLANGTRVRIFLSAAVPDLGGPAARLSISAYRIAPGSE
jgi:hypothetical protein